MRVHKQAFVFVVLAVFIGLFFVSNVSRDITEEDKIYVEKILQRSGYDVQNLENTNQFQKQISSIRAVQDSILNETPKQDFIAYGQSREPKDLMGRGGAHCGDRSRFLDKALRLLGYQTRYLSAYDTSNVSHPLFALAVKNTSATSHALLEVKTEKGWMLVDSVSRWIALTQEQKIYSAADWQKEESKENVLWDRAQSGKIYSVLENQFSYFYGLYSRHGKFYPPYVPVPDINWQEFVLNF